MDEEFSTGAVFGLLIGILLTILVGFIVYLETRQEMLDYWIPGTEQKGDIIIYKNKVITPKNLVIIFPDEAD